MRFPVKTGNDNKVFGIQDTLLVKGVAILLMMYHHCFRLIDYNLEKEISSAPFSMFFLVDVAVFCKLCVPIFVFLSAYGMMISVKKIRTDMDLTAKEFVLYTKKRLINLMTGWIFIFFICQIFCLLMNKRPINIYYDGSVVKAGIEFVIDMLGLADLFGTASLIKTWWYMSLAIVIIIIFPCLVLLYRKIGALGMVLLSVILPRIISFSYDELKNYFLIIVLGMVFADKDLLVKIREISIVKAPFLNKAIKGVLALILLMVCFKVRRNPEINFLYEVRYSLMGVFLVYLSYEFLSSIKYINTCLRFIGKHSMNIFLIHSFIRHTYFSDFIYGFHYPILIVIALVSSSLLVSVLLEFIKKVSGYNKLCKKLELKLNS